MKNHLNYKLLMIPVIFVLALVSKACNKSTESTLLFGSLEDIDGNVYKTIEIGTQTWMAENLRTLRYNDGTPIPRFADTTTWVYPMEHPGFGWYNEDSTNYNKLYGALYNYNPIKSGKLCPTSWHVSTDSDWKTLTDFLGGENVAGGVN